MSVPPAFVTEQIIEDVDVPCCGYGDYRIQNPQPGSSDDPDGCITTPIVKALKAAITM